MLQVVNKSEQVVNRLLGRVPGIQVTTSDSLSRSTKNPSSSERWFTTSKEEPQHVLPKVQLRGEFSLGPD